MKINYNEIITDIAFNLRRKLTDEEIEIIKSSYCKGYKDTIEYIHNHLDKCELQ